ncbi:hypothetical protein C5F50_07545 [Nitrosopumilus ureiphilus]|uniref:Uncharacterized protein n=2 Tax=Nitrosopumilus ureiphilus TaxID=1470067 RepID=A0A7D5R3F1_9ARCH|nr:hypothetical protein C5F50_07545 [Nitrosopumilus ureiphilus]
MSVETKSGKITFSKNTTPETNSVSKTTVRHYTIDVNFKKDLDDYNPTLKSVLKIEELFQKHGEFDSKSQLSRALGGSMKMPVLTVILKYLKSLGKILDNDDGSWTWIFAKDNKKLRKSWDHAVEL